MHARVPHELASFDVDPRIGVVGIAPFGSDECCDSFDGRLW